MLMIGFFSSCNRKIAAGQAYPIYSSYVLDSFDIYVTLPDSVKPSKAYPAFFYLDAGINSGKKLREMLAMPEYTFVRENYVFIGIAHKGDFHLKRRRDFIPLDITTKDSALQSANFGHAENFYYFLKNELLPVAIKNYHLDSSQLAILGHSFGGLFATYCLFRGDSPFSRFYSLSPSLWVNAYAIFGQEYIYRNPQVRKYIFFSSGSMERLNFIKAGTDSLNRYFSNKQYQHLQYEYKVIEGKAHNSQVPESLSMIFCAAMPDSACQ